MKKDYKQETSLQIPPAKKSGIDLDGYHSAKEIVGYGVTMVLFFMGGVISVIGLLAAGQDLQTCGRVFSIIVSLGVFLVLLRVSAETLYAILDLRRERIEEILQGPRQVKRPIILHQSGTPEVTVELPNEEEISLELMGEFFQTVATRGGKTWSREYWANSPNDPSRPGLGVMTQSQWSGIKELCERSGIWRSTNRRQILQTLDRMVNND